ncbi:hypothetical protein EDF58_103169 [Novosphingobium sp. PhB57]|uniref:hypothetical protein n=1 Tax=unclassified Novosphingobium TaxID=2644732 RepID=UPI001050DCE5|nr:MULTISPECIES: hypothetical protein [unclassified Novosphingobium]TCU58634.1 hypothetical protein EDF58_103169 [Novosphingobium sp. PhB57]TDW61640.1 hypothetical protein EDF57_10842 [Novosphingobium sp. PhB55]
MPIAKFETPDGDEIEVDPADVVNISEGREDETTIIELDDGDEVVVVATRLEVAAELGLDPLDFVDPDEDDEPAEDYDDDDESDSE